MSIDAITLPAAEVRFHYGEEEEKRAMSEMNMNED